MVDIIRITLAAGDGGDGRMSFLRSRHQPKGGPDGGDGADGGNIVLRGNQNLHSLRDFAGKSKIEANSGQMGRAAKQHGANAEDVILDIPVGTLVWRVRGAFEPIVPKRMYKITEEGEREEWMLNPERRKPVVKPHEGAHLTIDPSTHGIVVSSPESALRSKVFHLNGETLEADLVGEVTADGQLVTVVKGGKGGRGNFQFRSSSHTTPREAETGEEAERGVFIFELQSLADVGFVGYPNAGKSTLLSVLTNATPQIANYPFTTLEPNLGILQFGNPKDSDYASYLLADIPGIIEGASEGKGLGIAFLRHIERCKVLLFVLALDDYEVMEGMDEPTVLADKLTKQYEDLSRELDEYEVSQEDSGEGRVPLKEKKRIVVINKADLYMPELKEAIEKAIAKHIPTHLFISAKTMDGIEELRKKIQKVLK